MQIFVRSLAGQTSAVDVAADATVADVRAHFDDDLQLVFAGKSLNDSDVLAALGITEESTLFATSELLGGGKKRKKKVYTKPKKIKHKKKKVKLAVLKFYKVDGNNKVTKLRKECPNETCGPGVFMAMHFNRYYCGKCHLTYLIKKD